MTNKNEVKCSEYDTVLILDVESMQASGCNVFWKDGTNQLEFRFKDNANYQAATELQAFFNAMEYSPNEVGEMHEAISQADIRITVARMLSAHMTYGGFTS